MSEIHELSVRVYYEDTDAMSIVYYANYLRYAERARTEMLLAGGFDHAEEFKKTGIGFAVAAVEVSYKLPARLGDTLTVKTKPIKLGGASVKLQQNIYRGDELVTEMDVTLVCVCGKMKTQKIPQEVREIFKA